MRTFIIAALTADGFIARDKSQLADWTSKEDKKLFVELTKQAGVMVMGANTFKTIGRALPGRRNIVYSRNPIDSADIEVTKEPPAELVKRLEGEGQSALAICGGREIYSQFLQAGQVDEIYLSIEPCFFGVGVSLFNGPADVRLKLMETRQLNDNTVLLHYEVQK